MHGKTYGAFFKLLCEHGKQLKDDIDERHQFDLSFIPPSLQALTIVGSFYKQSYVVRLLSALTTHTHTKTWKVVRKKRSAFVSRQATGLAFTWSDEKFQT
jgi:hypothetical protein